MLQDVRTAIARAGTGMWRDLLGVAALGVSFYAALHVPALLSAV